MSIRARLLLITLLATLIPALLVFGRFVQDRRLGIDDDTRRLAHLAEHVAETIADRIQGTAQLHFGLARARDLATDDRAACSAFLSEVREAYPQYTGILTIRPDGRLFCDSLRSGRELDLNDRAYFRAAKAARGEVVLEPVFGRLTGQAVLQIAYPVRTPPGDLQYVLLASLNLKTLAMIDHADVSEARLVLVDRRGTVLAVAPTQSPMLPVGQSIADTPLFRFASAARGAEAADLAMPGGENHRWAVADNAAMKKAGLLVLAGAPQRALVAPADQRFGQDMGLLALAAAGLFLAVWLFAELALRRPVTRITGMARQLAEGDLSARIAPPLPRGELGTLMGVLNQTAQSLEDQRDDIASLNARLRHSERLEAVGQLTGGVAHDFNNLLTVVQGNAELLAEQLADQPLQRQLATTIGSAAQRGATLTRQLLAFARKQALDPSPTDINRLVAGLEPMLRRTLGEHIRIDTVPGPALWPALVDAGQLENALLNLCLNARDAMPGGGRIMLETANAPLGHDDASRFPDLIPGDHVMIAVTDTGRGIAREHLSQVFEPFFTTKEKGKGTGLGLAMVYGFVKQSSGQIGVYSEPGQGTTMRLYLPRAGADDARPAAAPPPPDTTGGSETVLVVEDDDLVRRYACDELVALGYRVVDAASGPQAIELLRGHFEVELLFTDVVMPGGMSGRELADAAVALRPGLRVLYTSGYAENAIVHHGRLDPGVMLLPKPYGRAQLARAVRAALAAATTPVS